MSLKTISLGVLMSLSCAITAKNNLIADKLDVLATEIKLDGDSVRLNLTFRMKSLLGGQESLELFPFLSTQSATSSFPGLILNGKVRSKVRERDAAFMSSDEKAELAKSGLQFFVVQPLPFIYNYRGAIGYEPWMKHAALDLSLFGCLCGREQIKLQAEVREGIVSDTATEGGKTINLLTDAGLPGPYDHIIPMMKVAVIKPETYAEQRKEIQQEVRFDFEASRSDLNKSFMNNSGSMSDLKLFLNNLSEQNAEINKIVVSGYASPEGTYEQNLSMSKKRAESFAKELQSSLDLTDKLFDIEYFGEDWDGLEKILKNHVTSYQKDALNIIETTDIFDGRERKLMELDGGKAYHHMMDTFFPLLRRADFRIDYTLKVFEPETLKKRFCADPNSLSLNELNQLLNLEEFGSSVYRRLLSQILSLYPEDQTALLNVAAIALVDNDPDKAWEYMNRKSSEGQILELENNLGIYFLMKGNLHEATRVLEKAASAGYLISTENIQYIIN